jgi:hypothetical protein
MPLKIRRVRIVSSVYATQSPTGCGPLQCIFHSIISVTWKNANESPSQRCAKRLRFHAKVKDPTSRKRREKWGTLGC